VQDRLRRAELTYPEVGCSVGRLPAGYDHVRRSRRIGTGPECFHAAAAALFGWQLHARAGLRPVVSASAAGLGAVVMLRFGIGRLAVTAPCRVVAVIGEARRRGFAYGTLPGHPEQGEEAFLINHACDGAVILHITAFSRPASLTGRLVRPLGRAAQRHITNRYLHSLTE
jgi:uncharacterized protein (UPF0548 family)